jgi:beta-phosphoglucomutase
MRTFFAILLTIFLSYFSFVNASLPPKAIIFDCDGVLIDNGNAYFLDWQYALEQQGFALSPELFWDFMHKYELVGLPTADELILDFCCALLGRDCRETLRKDKEAFSRELHQKGFPPVVSTVEFLRELASKKEEYGFKLAVASASSRERILKNLKRIGIDSYFDLVISGQDDLIHYRDPEGVNKPKPYIYEYTAQKLSVKPCECVVIEDSKTGVIAAVSAGCFTIAVPTQATSKQNLSSANMVIPSLSGMNCPAFFEMLWSDR